MALPPLACNGCRKCCLGDTIVLMPGDNPSNYATRQLPDGRRALKHGKDGNCVYLGKRGCQIHGRAPRMCRTLDCRSYYLKVEAMPQGEQAKRYADPQKRRTLLEGRRRVEAINV